MSQLLEFRHNNVILVSSSNHCKVSPLFPPETPENQSTLPLTPPEELQLQQLRQLRHWEQIRQSELKNATSAVESESVPHKPDLPENWELTRGLVLHAWQKQCIDSWFRNGKRGIIKVVTGAGKTILALGIAEKLQQNEAHQLRIAVVVPTIVLLEQWRDEFVTRSNLPPGSIGLVGGGRNDRFGDGVVVLICVLNSASKKLASEVERARVSENLLLVVDECHRAAASEMKHVFETKRAYSLGLSATPERDDDPLADQDLEVSEDSETAPMFDETILGRELGSIIFEMNYADAILAGVLPPFRVVHYGLSLRAPERERYEKVSREIKDLRAELETNTRRGLALIRWCRSKAALHNPKAARLIGLTSERKRLLYSMSERANAVVGIIRSHFEEGANTRAILFHENIDSVMELFDLLRRLGYPVVAEHSKFPDQMRAESLRLFRNGAARIIVSARSLIEGFNVPTADLGIVVAASSSVRQRVQTLGRLLRKSSREDGSEKQATLYVLYASNTVDELIYEKADWNKFIGADRNEYFAWDNVNVSEPNLSSGPPRVPALDESLIDPTVLREGDAYPGDASQGALYSLDTQGSIRDENGRYIQSHPQLLSLLLAHGRAAGRFRVTPVNRFVLKLDKTVYGWSSVYLGRLDSPIQLADFQTSVDDLQRSYSSGDSYPLARAVGITFSVLQRDKRLIAKKSSSGIKFVVPLESIHDAAKQAALRNLQRQLTAAYSRGHRMNKITVTQEGHVVYVVDNHAYFVGDAPEGANGFIFEGEEITQ